MIANWRDRVIYIEDKTVDDSPVLKDSTPLKDEIAALKETRKEAELLFKSMSSSYQKHHREPDNRLDPKTRNAYKREAKKTIADCDTKLVDRRRRLSRWADTPENWTKTTKTIKVEWKFSECLREPCTREDYEKKWADCIDAVPDETKPEIVAAQRTWVQRENDIIRLAIKAGLCRPSESIIRMYPQLLIKAIKDRTKGRGQDYQDLAENKLIDKESGSSIGTTTVHSGGYYYNLKNSLGRIRPFESFDKSARRSGSKLNDQEPEGLDSGDYSERDGNE